MHIPLGSVKLFLRLLCAGYTLDCPEIPFSQAYDMLRLADMWHVVKVQEKVVNMLLKAGVHDYSVHTLALSYLCKKTAGVEEVWRRHVRLLVEGTCEDLQDPFEAHWHTQIPRSAFNDLDGETLRELVKCEEGSAGLIAKLDVEFSATVAELLAQREVKLTAAFKAVMDLSMGPETVQAKSQQMSTRKKREMIRHFTVLGSATRFYYDALVKVWKEFLQGAFGVKDPDVVRRNEIEQELLQANKNKRKPSNNNATTPPAKPPAKAPAKPTKKRRTAANPNEDDSQDSDFVGDSD
jgi:hypothetical protein